MTNIFMELQDFDLQSREILMGSKNSFLDLTGRPSAGAGNLPLKDFPNIFSGETIRGMKNVSPLATVKFFNQTWEQIYSKYFVNADLSLEGAFTVVSDAGSDISDEIKKTAKDFYYYGKEEAGYFAFRVIVFSSTEATKLKECFEVSKPEENEILIFMEDNTGDSVSGTYGAVKISQKIIDALSLKNRLAYDIKDNANIYEELRKIVPELTNEQLKSLFYNGYIEDTRIDAVKIWLKIASFFSGGISTVFPALGIITNDMVRKGTSHVLGEIIEKIEESRLEEYRWQPKAPKNGKGELDKDYHYQPLISSEGKDDTSVNMPQFANILQKMLDEQRNYVKDKLRISKNFSGNSEPDNLLEFLYHNYFKTYKIAKSVIGQIQDLSDLEILKYGAKTYNALLCGVWNGLVDAVSGLFAIVKMMYDGITLGKDFMQNIDKYLPTLLEQFDEAIQAIEKLNFTEIAKYIYGKLKEVNLTFDPIACAYFAGYAFGFIISLIIEIILTVIATGTTLTIPVIVEKLSEALFGIFRLAWKNTVKVIRTFNNFVVRFIEDVIKGFQELLNFLKKGWDEIRKIIDNAFEALKEIKFTKTKYGKIYRVQGGTDLPNFSKFRLHIKNNKVVIDGEDMLHITFDDVWRVAHFWTKRGKESEVFVARIDKSFIDKIRKEAVSQKRGKEFPSRPQIDDPTKTSSSFGIPKSYFDELIKSIKEPDIIKPEE
ncbi:hypothetical protein [Chryseobacterium sp.]|uniref:hypothetical protein n=1 Tax=Chryseobacterium sp. TaxID=1871047 RepID=UPI0012AA34EF|nr:hypothetical protein [Chryseobacterium sp.]QFG54461.1 hypothetical protein F7R58_12660 [Chryseobacterium sp.]